MFLTAQQLCSLALYQAKFFSNNSRSNHRLYTNIFDAMNPEGRTLDTYSIEKLLDNASEITHIHYDVCDRNCIYYTAYPDLQACPACHLPRHRPNGKPWHTFDYIPIIHRIRLQMADRRLAKKIWKYPNRLMETRTENPDLIRDI